MKRSIPQNLDAWFQSPLGKELIRRERTCIEHLLQDTFGYYLLQIGFAIHFEGAVAASRIRYRILIPPHRDRSVLGRQIVARPEQLPIATDSVDLVFLPHTLDFSTDPHQVLREADRVLIPEGRILVVGFNPLSAWGARRLFFRQRQRPPWCGRFLTPFRVWDWLSLLGFSVEYRTMLLFRPPWRQALIKETGFMEALGTRFWPFFGGAYAIRAVKRVSTLTPIRPTWRPRRALLPGDVVKPTTRKADDVEASL